MAGGQGVGHIPPSCVGHRAATVGALMLSLPVTCEVVTVRVLVRQLRYEFSTCTIALYRGTAKIV